MQSSATKQSVIDPRFAISHDLWVVSLLRCRKARQPQHTFIMLEGINQFNQGIIARYELGLNQFESEEVPDDARDTSECYIFVKEPIPMAIDKVDASIKRLMKLKKDDNWYFRSFQISLAKAVELRISILEDKEKDIKYDWRGDKGVSISREETENCFTWARKKLHGLNLDHVKIPDKKIDYLVAVPGLYLTETQDEPRLSGPCLVM